MRWTKTLRISANVSLSDIEINRLRTEFGKIAKQAEYFGHKYTRRKIVYDDMEVIYTYGKNINGIQVNAVSPSEVDIKSAGFYFYNPYYYNPLYGDSPDSYDSDQYVFIPSSDGGLDENAAIIIHGSGSKGTREVFGTRSWTSDTRTISWIQAGVYGGVGVRDSSVGEGIIYRDGIRVFTDLTDYRPSIYKYGLSTKRYFRGAALTDEGIYIGVSTLRPAYLRFQSESSVVFYDESGSVLNSIQIVDGLNEVISGDVEISPNVKELSVRVALIDLTKYGDIVTGYKFRQYRIDGTSISLKSEQDGFFYFGYTRDNILKSAYYDGTNLWSENAANLQLGHAISEYWPEHEVMYFGWFDASRFSTPPYISYIVDLPRYLVVGDILYKAIMEKGKPVSITAEKFEKKAGFIQTKSEAYANALGNFGFANVRPGRADGYSDYIYFDVALIGGSNPASLHEDRFGNIVIYAPPFLIEKNPNGRIVDHTKKWYNGWYNDFAFDDNGYFKFLLSGGVGGVRETATNIITTG